MWEHTQIPPLCMSILLLFITSYMIFLLLQHKELDHLSYKNVGRSTFVGDLTSFELFHKFLNKFSLAFKCISARHTLFAPIYNIDMLKL